MTRSYRLITPAAWWGLFFLMAHALRADVGAAAYLPPPTSFAARSTRLKASSSSHQADDSWWQPSAGIPNRGGYDYGGKRGTASNDPSATWNSQSSRTNNPSSGSSGGYDYLSAIASQGRVPATSASSLGLSSSTPASYYTHGGGPPSAPLVRLLVEDLFEDNTNAISDALKLLTTMANSGPDAESNCEAICEAGGATIVVGVMKKWSQDPVIQSRACLLLEIASAASNRFRSSMLNAGGLDAVLEAMRQHPLEESVQCDGCGVLSSLTFNRMDADRLVYDLRGHLLIVQAMYQFPDSFQLQHFACGAIWNLTQWNELRDVIAESGADVALLEALRNFPMNTVVALPPQDEYDNVGRHELETLQRDARMSLIRLIWNEDYFGATPFKNVGPSSNQQQYSSSSSSSSPSSYYGTTSSSDFGSLQSAAPFEAQPSPGMKSSIRSESPSSFQEVTNRLKQLKQPVAGQGMTSNRDQTYSSSTGAAVPPRAGSYSGQQSPSFGQQGMTSNRGENMPYGSSTGSQNTAVGAYGSQSPSFQQSPGGQAWGGQPTSTPGMTSKRDGGMPYGLSTAPKDTTGAYGGQQRQMPSPPAYQQGSGGGMGTTSSSYPGSMSSGSPSSPNQVPFSQKPASRARDGAMSSAPSSYPGNMSQTKSSFNQNPATPVRHGAMGATASSYLDSTSAPSSAAPRKSSFSPYSPNKAHNPVSSGQQQQQSTNAPNDGRYGGPSAFDPNKKSVVTGAGSYLDSI